MSGLTRGIPTQRLAQRLAQWLALGVPAALLGGAYIGQYAFGLYPCEMCWWQRYAHFAALAFAVLAFALPAMAGRLPARWGAPLLVTLAALAILIAGLLGGFHAGVEYGWWKGFTACTSQLDLSVDPLDAILNAPLVRCDTVQWSLAGISLAGYNFLISVPAALLILALLARNKEPSV